MRLVVQRVTQASVRVEEETIGQIQKGILVFVGIGQTDTPEIVDKMLNKMLALRIFEDSEGKTNLSLKQVEGEVLLVSQFTLYADCRKGNRPSFIKAGAPQMANELYEYMISKCREQVAKVETGEFGADMKVSLENDGPFTILLDSDEIC